MPRGGARKGAGRPNAFESAIREIVKLEKILADKNIPKGPKGYRVPPDAPQAVKDAADYAFQRLVDVAAGRVSKEKASAILKAAVEIRKEICGPVAQKVDVDVKGRLEHLLEVSMSPVPRPALPEAKEEGEALGAPPSIPTSLLGS